MVESKDFRRQAKECMAVFFKMCEKCYRKSCSICVMNLQGRKVKKKKINFTKWKFRAQRYEEIWPAKVGKPWREKGGAHADRIRRLYCKGRPASKLTWCEPSGDHLDYLWLENTQRTSPQITGRAKAMTMLRLEKCNLDTLWELVHSIPHHLEKHKLRHSG